MLEILAPAGNYECAEAAIANGANAIYLGYTAFSARDGAENFNEEALKEVLVKAHFLGVKVYVAMNTIVKTEELKNFITTLLHLWNLGVDAIILQDLLLGKYLHERYPSVVLHLSTQAGVCTAQGAELAKEYGFSRVILARETPLADIRLIAKILETEVFVQGALCTCFSGQCYFSSFVGGNSGNRGRCKQPCRKKYSYDRLGYEEQAYALSLADLCVGEDIKKLVETGVVSFKIEGRMRRKEYVGAAVKYYRQLLDGATEKQLFTSLSDLKRAYNRGNYTKGLAFSQDKRFLSRAVQGHLGEKVGTVKVLGGKYFVESAFRAAQGDCFKILRDGKEVGGAAYSSVATRGFYVFSKLRLKNGDGVFVTTDTAAQSRAVGESRTARLSLSLHFAVGECAVAACGDISVVSAERLQAAQKSALTVEDIKNCFLKTDGLPITVTFDKVELFGEVFMAKSSLNAFRRAFYARIVAQVQNGGRETVSYLPFELINAEGKNEKTAVISGDFRGITTDVAIYKPNDYANVNVEEVNAICGEKYLYVPPFKSCADVEVMKQLLLDGVFDGIYAENYDGIKLSLEWGCKLFAGTGFHLTNPISLSVLLTLPNLSYYAISKELSHRESQNLASAQSFMLTSGDIKIMDLCYCPFEKTCGKCDRREIYVLTDEHGRRFPVRRYLGADGICRFEVYNCASLIGAPVVHGRLVDVTVTGDKSAAVAAKREEEQKQTYAAYTSGHTKSGVL